MKKNHGFTVVELIVVIALFLIIFSFSWINFGPLFSRSSTDIDSQTLLADIRSQQTQSMSGDSSGGSSQSAYGIYFESDGYTLFKGDGYFSNDPSNFKVSFTSDNLEFSDILFPNQTVVFEKGSGEVVGFVTGSSSVSIHDKLTNTSKVIRINKYGATY